MKNINPYQKEIFRENFSKTKIYQDLTKDFDMLSFNKCIKEYVLKVTPRFFYGARPIPLTQFSVVPFYYLEYLLEKNPATIYDLGCGWNIFKKYIPNIIGVGAEPIDTPYFFGDIHDYVDDEYIAGHQNFFESVFSINALHFRPLSEFEKIVNDFYSMIKPGGRGFLAVNLDQMLIRDRRFHSFTANELEQYCREVLDKLTHIKFLVVDIDFTFPADEMDGNIRLVMEK